MYADEIRKKQSVANTFTGANNNKELFFLLRGKKFGLFLYKEYVRFLRCIKKALNEKFIIGETYFFKKKLSISREFG